MTQQWGQQPAQGPAGQPAWAQPQQPWGPAQPGWGQPVVQQRPPQGYPPYPAQAPYQGQPGGYPPQPPQRGGGSVKLVLLGVVAVIAVGFFAFSLTNYLNASGQTTGPEPVPTPEIGETSAPPTGVPDPEFDPPALPQPTSWEEVDAWLLDNALYAESVQVPTNCTLGRIDVEAVSPSTLQEHLNTLTGCLMMVWQEPMARAGFVMPRPPVTVYTAPITSACGDTKLTNAAYCSGDQRLYYAADVHEAYRRYNPEVIGNAFLPDYVMGHEFGHALQGRTGILIAEYIKSDGTTEAEQLEGSRRVEVQADCFAGVFLNAVAQASQMTDEERAGIAALANAIGDDSLSGRPDVVGNHGRGASRQYWAQTGMANNQAGACNTFAAPPEQVR